VLNLESFTSLITLTAMETVLGIDNIIFIAILVGRLPRYQREKIRRLGITLALGIRVLLLLSISWIMSLTQPLFDALGRSFSGRDLILLGGGLFLIGKATFEIHHKLEGDPEVHLHHAEQGLKSPAPGSMLFQILLLDIVFSLDSVITAVGMANQVPIMVTAMLISMLVMLASAKTIGEFVERHPTLKILALSFLLMIGGILVGEAFGAHLSKGYLYFAMSFSLAVEILNMRYRKKSGGRTRSRDQ
jgi:predicted tellurium resistance membrane protein TerC